MKVKNYDTTLLNNEFSYKVQDNFKNNSLTFWDEIIDRGITYDIIYNEMTDLGYDTYKSELKYRLDDNEDINDIFLSIITRNEMVESTLGYHQGALQMYLDEDIMKLFK